MEIFIFVVIIGLLGLIIIVNASGQKTKEDNKPVKLDWFAQQKKNYEGMNYKVIDTKTHRFIFNNDLKKIVCDVCDTNNRIMINKIFNYADLVKCEFTENNKLVGSASFGGAAIGGLVGGTTGAIIGSSIGKTKKYYSCHLVMMFNDFNISQITIVEELPEGTPYNDRIKNISSQCHRLYGLCEYVINQNKMDAQ